MARGQKLQKVSAIFKYEPSAFDDNESTSAFGAQVMPRGN